MNVVWANIFFPVIKDFGKVIGNIEVLASYAGQHNALIVSNGSKDVNLIGIKQKILLYNKVVHNTSESCFKNIFLNR